MLAEKNLTGKFKFQSSEAVKEFSKWLVSIGQDFSYKEKDYRVTVKFDFDEDYNAAEAKDDARQNTVVQLDEWRSKH